MKKTKDTKLTSINIDAHLYKQFKRKAIESDISFKDFVTEALHKFVSSSDYINFTIVSGSV